MNARVLVVDDSAVMRKLLTEGLIAEGGIDVVGTAPDPIIARDKLLALEPDVITLDVEMPRLDGIQFLRAIMKHKPMPVIVVSSLTAQGSRVALEALDGGAFDVLVKPADGGIRTFLATLAERVRAGARTTIRRPPEQPPAAPALATSGQGEFVAGQLVAIASSTGGTEALAVVMAGLPANCPPVVIVQHIHPSFVESLAARLDRGSALNVQVAREGESLRPGMARLAPGDVHLVVRRGSSGELRTALVRGPKVCQVRPAADVLMRSVAEANGLRSVGVVLTGMGEDGAEGLAAMRLAGARTLAQNEATCVVFGMPKAAHRRGGVEDLVAIDAVPRVIVAKLRRV